MSQFAVKTDTKQPTITQTPPRDLNTIQNEYAQLCAQKGEAHLKAEIWQAEAAGIAKKLLELNEEANRAQQAQAEAAKAAPADHKDTEANHG